MSFRAALNWNNALPGALVLGCIVVACLLSRGNSAAVSSVPPTPIGRAVALRTNLEEPPDFAAEDELRARKIPVSILNQTGTLEEEIRSIAEAAHCQIVIDWKALAGAKIDRKVPYALAWTPDLSPGAQVALGRALTWIVGSFKDASLAYQVENGVIVISTETDSARHTLSIVYDLRDVISAIAATGEPRAEVIEQLHAMVVNSVAMESWKETGGSASLEEVGGLFVIKQAASNHRKILALLASMRSRIAASSTRPTFFANGAPSSLPTPAGAEIAMLNQKIATLHIDEFISRAAAMRELSHAAKLVIYVNWNSLEAADIHRDVQAESGTYQDIPVGEAIRIILGPHGHLSELTIEEDSGGLVIEARTSTQFYDVRYLIDGYVKSTVASGDTRLPENLRQEAAQHLLEAVLKQTGGGWASEFGGILAVRQSPEGQARVAELLEGFRAAGLAIPTTRLAVPATER